MGKKEKAVFITGASSGIGRSTALLLAKKGYTVFAAARREDKLGELEKESSSYRGKIVPIKMDVKKEEDISKAFETVEAKKLELVAVVNNAGIVIPGPIEIMPIDAYREQFAVNVEGVLIVSKKFLPLLRESRGKLINVSSIVGRVPMKFIGLYSASKFALEAISETLDKELSRSGVRVVLIEPGAVKTEIWGEAYSLGVKYLNKIPLTERELYSGVIEKLLEVGGKPPKFTTSPRKVAKVIYKVVKKKNPKIRYLVGLDAKVALLTYKILPYSITKRLF